jgi:hypothetical protein
MEIYCYEDSGTHGKVKDITILNLTRFDHQACHYLWIFIECWNLE